MRDVLKVTSLWWLGMEMASVSVSGEVDISGYQCFDDPKVIYYDNAPEVEVDILPSVRMMMCGYSSQCALNMVGYLFMKEKLGMNMRFFPTNDYDNVWSGEFWGGWADPYAYPKYYFEWLYNDSMDLNLEFWPVQLVMDGFDGRSDYVLAEADAAVYPEIEGKSRIDYGGDIGAYGEISIYIPKYWAEEFPTDLIPSLYATDMALRESLIEAAINGTTDYVWKYERRYELIADYFKYKYNFWALYNATLDVTAIETEYAEANITYWNGSWNVIEAVLNQTELEAAFPFDRPTYDRPIVWGSVDSYAMSEYAYFLVNASGMNVSFVTTGSESSLMELVSDLYARRMPFLANIYTIDDNFAVTDPVTGELQQFEKLSFPRNPDQSIDDPCYVAKECQNPIEPIMKAANPRLKERFPEAHSFFTGFTMGTREINQIVSYYLILKAENDNKTWAEKVSHTEVWLEAACHWLKSDDPAAIATWNTSEWNVDVTRSQCSEECGLPIGDEMVGGTCNYYTGQCECEWEELFADTHCKESCPGLMGPFMNTSNSTDIYYFEFCSGNGTCDATTGQCLCYDGYRGVNCTELCFGFEIPRDLMVYALLGALAFVIFCWILREFCLCCKRKCRKARSNIDYLPNENADQAKLLVQKVKIASSEAVRI